MASSPSQDVKPMRRCRKCHLPMKGHKADTCGITEEGAAAAAAPMFPATPPTTPQNVNAITARTRANIEIGVSRHWRDPSWTPHVAIPPPRPDPADSSPPTVLVDEDGNTIINSSARGRVPASVAGEPDNDSNGPPSPIRSTSRRPKTPMAQVMDQAHALSLCDPVLSIVRVSLVDLPRMQVTAGQQGLVTSIVRAPWAGPRFKDDSLVNGWEEEEDTKKVWVVVGDDPTLVQRTAELQQHFEKVPGAIKDDIVVVQATFKSVVLASIVGGLVVLAGMGILF